MAWPNNNTVVSVFWGSQSKRPHISRISGNGISLASQKNLTRSELRNPAATIATPPILAHQVILHKLAAEATIRIPLHQPSGGSHKRRPTGFTSCSV